MADIRTEGQGSEEHPKLSVIRKLLAKASDPSCTEEERESLNAKAAELSAKYGIEMAMATGGRVGDEMVIKEFVIYEAEATIHGTLIYRIAEALRCKPLMMRDPQTGELMVAVVGYLSDIDRLELLYTSLSLQMAGGVVREYPRGTAVQRRTWMTYFISAVKDRIEAAEKNAADEAEAAGTPGTALVLADRSLAVRRAADAEFPGFRQSTSKRKIDPLAAARGHAAGQRANLGGTSVGGAGRAALAGAR